MLFGLLFCVLMRFTEHSYSNWLFDLFFVVFFLHESCDFTLLLPPVHLFVTWLRCDLKGRDLSEVVSHRSLSSHDVRSSVPRARSKMGEVVSDVGMWAWFLEKSSMIIRKKRTKYTQTTTKGTDTLHWQNRMRNNSKNYSDTEIRRWQRKDDILCQFASPDLRKSTGRHRRLNSDVSEPTNLIAPRKLQDRVSS